MDIDEATIDEGLYSRQLYATFLPLEYKAIADCIRVDMCSVMQVCPLATVKRVVERDLIGSCSYEAYGHVQRTHRWIGGFGRRDRYARVY